MTVFEKMMIQLVGSSAVDYLDPMIWRGILVGSKSVKIISFNTKCQPCPRSPDISPEMQNNLHEIKTTK